MCGRGSLYACGVSCVVRCAFRVGGERKTVWHRSVDTSRGCSCLASFLLMLSSLLFSRFLFFGGVGWRGLWVPLFSGSPSLSLSPSPSLSVCVWGGGWGGGGLCLCAGALVSFFVCWCSWRSFFFFFFFFFCLVVFFCFVVVLSLRVLLARLLRRAGRRTYFREELGDIESARPGHSAR